MIDDDWRIIKKLSDNSIKTLYFRDTKLKKLEETEYISEVILGVIFIEKSIHNLVINYNK